MTKIEGQLEAVRMAAENLRGADLVARCALLGLPAPENGAIRLRAFGEDMRLRVPEFSLESVPGKPARPGDHILALHYLQCDLPVKPGGDLITFRDFPGGQFYLEPFLSRTIKPLLRRVGNDPSLLEQKLARYDWSRGAAEGGALNARIHALGNLFGTLIWRPGDEEFSPTADFLFDPAAKRALNAEDAAYLASRICLGLL